MAEYGDPVAGGTSYHLCIYDDGALSAQLNAPAGQICKPNAPCWKSRSSGYDYHDRDGTPSGISRIKLIAGTDRRAKIHIQARGANMGLASAASSTQYFNGGTSVQVQLVRDDNGACWETTHTPPYLRNVATWFSGQ